MKFRCIDCVTVAYRGKHKNTKPGVSVCLSVCVCVLICQRRSGESGLIGVNSPSVCVSQQTGSLAETSPATGEAERGITIPHFLSFCLYFSCPSCPLPFSLVSPSLSLTSLHCTLLSECLPVYKTE